MEVENNILLPEVKHLLDIGHHVLLTPKGVSMRPFIEGGRDSVVLKSAKRQHLKVGDIVLAKVDDRYVLHRIFKREGDQLVLRGDGNLQGTETCPRNHVIAFVATIIKPDKKELVPSSGFWWRHAPYIVRKYGLKVYRKWMLPILYKQNN